MSTNPAASPMLATTILSERHTALLDELSEALEQPALLWASGYLAGRAALRKGALPASITPGARSPVAQSPAESAGKLTVLYGSQTGNAKRVAEQLAAAAHAAGLAVQLVRADAYKTHQLKKEKLLYIVISTHSEGDAVEPPDDSRDFIEFLEGPRAPKLPALQYAVLALGDTSYPGFCGIGREVDARLAALGARRLQPLGEADVDIETVAAPWREKALGEARKLLEAPETPGPTRGATITPLYPAEKRWSRENPFTAEILVSQPIVAQGSSKDIRHIELSLEGSGIHYQPGDALGVWPQQAPALVARIAALLHLDLAQPVRQGEVTLELGQWLTGRRELTLLTRPFIEAQAKRGAHADLLALLQPEAAAQLGQLLKRTQLVDFLGRWPASWEAEALVAALRPLAPRMYSIASSPAVAGEDVHLTVARLHYQHEGEDRWGVATRHLFDLAPGDSVPVFIDPNDRFRLPADPATDIILIGPGTGVAPFRAFVQEREESGATGRQWLFFGNPNRRTDFLYQTEWQQALQNGALARLSVAFSRDQEHKIYVQDRLRAEAADLWAWLAGGAHLYLCGDADRMAPDVHAALLDIVAEQGGKSAEEAASWLRALAREGRYARDVY